MSVIIDNDAIEYAVEKEYFGEKLGWLDVRQLSYPSFHKECSIHKNDSTITNDNDSKLENDGDNTGLRLYAGI